MDNVKQVIRVEHSDGLGMFWTSMSEERKHSVFYILPKLSSRHQSFNTPKEDGLAFIRGTHYCAYKSIEHIQQWVQPEEFEVLLDNGYTVYLLEISDYQEGKDNIIFKKEDIISKKNVNQLFTLNKNKL